jgi:hypothetical protein
MNFFTVKETINYKNRVFGEGELLKGETYYSFSQFAEEAAKQGFAEIISIEPLPFDIIDPNYFHGKPTEFKKILLYFAGGLGDAVVIGMILPFIENRFGIRFDICSSKEKWMDIFRPLDLKGSWVPYPPAVNSLRSYDGVITDITRFFSKDDNRISPILKICTGFGLDPKELPRTKYHLDEGLKTKLILPKSSMPKIGINFDSNGSVRSYPPPLHHDLLKRLKKAGFELYLLGHMNKNYPSFSQELAFDLRDKTTIGELAVLIKQMDLVVAMDSFISHMANIMEIPTLVLLSTTPSDVFSFHSDISCISSRLSCSPCYNVLNDCPLGNKECMAFYHDSIAPVFIASAVLEQLVKSFKKKISRDSERFPLSHAPCALRQ